MNERRERVAGESVAGEIFIPAFPISQITVKHTLSKIMIARLRDPEHVCGVARRVGYTGKQANDLATYRLKVKTSEGNALVTLPSVFVVQDGKFIEYEQWSASREIGQQ